MIRRICLEVLALKNLFWNTAFRKIQKEHQPQSVVLIRFQSHNCNFIEEDSDTVTSLILWVLLNFFKPAFFAEQFWATDSTFEWTIMPCFLMNYNNILLMVMTFDPFSICFDGNFNIKWMSKICLIGLKSIKFYLWPFSGHQALKG